LESPAAWFAVALCRDISFLNFQACLIGHSLIESAKPNLT